MMTLSIEAFHGEHCETTATGTLLKQLDIELSEPMLFGLGEGLGFIFWKMKTMSFPFIGGRVKTDLLTQNIAKNLNLNLSVKETSSKQKAWDNVKQHLDQGEVVGLKLDCFHLDYFSNPIHFAGHYVAIYGYDEESAYLIDTVQQGVRVKASLENLTKARAEKGPMSSKSLHYTINRSGRSFELSSAIITAIRNNAIDFLNPPIANVGYKGIEKTSSEIIKWYKTSNNIESEFRISGMMMEKAGTGGALFRNLYRDFLKESYQLLGLDTLRLAYEDFVEIAALWTSIANLFEQVSRTKDFVYIEQASAILRSLAEKEKKAMELLSKL
ncbi:BtrH N-terminal domain-containing protein [Desertivirga arenae]|uniref:BtrH N-terminal domain-containing protein n=1 Tax=Desertivirga arenae TaxID=2810309 RepID=UPI001F61E967|nr:BtrH N-terminal domain-containing protein [Pedobacter sp. SYSU D00823]